VHRVPSQQRNLALRKSPAGALIHTGRSIAVPQIGCPQNRRRL
jgi:hypothetical protein